MKLIVSLILFVSFIFPVFSRTPDFQKIIFKFERTLSREYPVGWDDEIGRKIKRSFDTYSSYKGELIFAFVGGKIQPATFFMEVEQRNYMRLDSTGKIYIALETPIISKTNFTSFDIERVEVMGKTIRLHFKAGLEFKSMDFDTETAQVSYVRAVNIRSKLLPISFPGRRRSAEASDLIRLEYPLRPEPAQELPVPTGRCVSALSSILAYPWMY